jgi:hypothetical protein
VAVRADQRPDVAHYKKATPQERDAVEQVEACVQQWERGLGVDFRENCTKRYRQYRGFQRFRDAWTKAGPNDKDGLLYDEKKHWGAQLHIPLSYRTIEAMVPRAIAHRPRMLYLPRQQRWEANVESVRVLHDAQQEQVDIDLPFQAVMRSGRIYGIGAGKCFWREEYGMRRRAKRRIKPLSGFGDFKLGDLERVKEFDDPDFEDIDIFDFMWDPFGSEVSRRSNRVGWIVHRLWFSLEACMDRIASGAWNTDSARQLTEEELRGMGSRAKYDEVWSDRMEMSGLNNTRDYARGEQIHEIHEWHDGHRVLTVLDRQVLVQDAENPCVGHFPFQVYRPTPLQYQMVGIGDLEPIEHLNRELDTMRSQRRDAATLALAPAIFYDSAVANRVDNARPSDAVFVMPKPDVPGSSFEDERVIKQDIDAVVGYNDAIDPSPGGSIGTATEAQLVQAALSKRIELSSRRFEIEVVRHAARCWLYMNQRMILENRDPIRVPGADSHEQSVAEGRWRWVPIGPGELQGEFEIIPEGGSMAAENVPQMRSDAMQLMQLFGQRGDINQERLAVKVLRLYGEKDPESWLKREDKPVPPMALEILKQMRVDPRLIDFAVTRAQQQDPSFPPDQGPTVPQVDQAMNGNGMAGAYG